MKKGLLNIILSSVICIAFATPVFAQNIYFTDSKQITNAAVKTSQDITKQPRGNITVSYTHLTLPTIRLV